MATKKTSTRSKKTPSKPSARKSTAKKAAAKKAPKPPAKPSKPSKPRAPRAAAKAPAPAEDSARVQELEAALEAMQGEVVKLTKAVSKAKMKYRTAEEILDGAENINLPADDWRWEYLEASLDGWRINMMNHSTAKGGDGLELHPDMPSIPDVLVAIPRDDDLGGKGARFRQQGHIALHWEAGEQAGTYVGGPAYLTQEEFFSVWIDE